MKVSDFLKTVAVYDHQIKSGKYPVNLVPVEVSQHTRKDMGDQSPVFRYYETPKLKIVMRLREDADPYKMKENYRLEFEAGTEFETTLSVTTSLNASEDFTNNFPCMNYILVGKTRGVSSDKMWCPHFNASHFDYISHEVIPVEIKTVEKRYC